MLVDMLTHSRFAPADIGAPIAQLPASERQALAKLVEAARMMDGLFLEQVWAGNSSMLSSLASDTTPLGRAVTGTMLVELSPVSSVATNVI